MTFTRDKTLLKNIGIILCCTVGLTACDKIPSGLFNQDVDTSKVEIPRTPPLQAGASVLTALRNGTVEPETTDQKGTAIELQSVDQTAAQSIVTNTDIPAGTPEAIVKAALNELYYGSVEKTAAYYHTADKSKIIEGLKNIQEPFKQSTKHITLTGKKSNSDNTEALINIQIYTKTSDKPNETTYRLQKINGEWMITL